MSRFAHVVIKVDTSAIERALRRLNESMRPMAIAFQRIGRQGWRSRLTPGERHIDRMVRDCLARRLPADEARIKLEVAVIAAGVLDGEAS